MKPEPAAVGGLPGLLRGTVLRQGGQSHPAAGGRGGGAVPVRPPQPPDGLYEKRRNDDVPVRQRR